ncbi:hypothetical protein CY34DRAFT_812968 [Suillus luteus UH-Slu-Lm8-n1]|uniref:Uncharacterized protein n=1 Tax=Suillus luteus UH-Slu-Lm8-n1 TaxID=930992 RepID=A0A0D0A8C3_9AGAM|nr:hypothetical protein CY34DRAFT_812968 [Suillus luteus UH-Slu-Lm8-n1]
MSKPEDFLLELLLWEPRVASLSSSAYAYAFEQATHVRLQRRAYDAAILRIQLTDIMSQL